MRVFWSVIALLAALGVWFVLSAPTRPSSERSAVIDALSTLVTAGTMLKVYAWYDNEMAYACRMVDLACHMQAQGL